MKRLTISFCTALFLLACSDNKDNTADSTTDTTTTTTTSTTDTATTTTAVPDSATMMKNWQAYMTPADAHKMMASWNGTWVGETQMWMTPDAPPTKSVSTAVNKMVLDGRYQQSTHTGNFMGMPFNGMSTLAYDNVKKVFISTWIDNFGTGLMVLQGPWDSTAKTITLTGKMVDPAIGKEVDVREVFTIVDNDNQVMEMYGKGYDGKEFKTMQINYKRKK